MSIKTKLPFILFFLLILISYSCKKEEDIIRINYIEKGCIPLKISRDSPLGEDSDNFRYIGNILERVGINIYEYNKYGQISKSTHGPNRFYNYFYDECSGDLNKYDVHEKGINGDELFTTYNGTFEYLNGEIVYIWESVRNTESYVDYHDGTNNISKIEKYDSTGFLLEKKTFEYDTFNNVYKNLTHPRNILFFSSIQKHSNNNIINGSKISFDSTPVDTFNYYYEYEYNEFNFPTKVLYYGTSGLFSIRDIEYTRCSD